jgi:hypothetical protein
MTLRLSAIHGLIRRTHRLALQDCRLTLDGGELGSGDPSGGSRIFQWGFAPVGGARANADGLTPNNLALGITLGTVTVSTT